MCGVFGVCVRGVLCVLCVLVCVWRCGGVWCVCVCVRCVQWVCACAVVHAGVGVCFGWCDVCMWVLLCVVCVCAREMFVCEERVFVSVCVCVSVCVVECVFVCVLWWVGRESVVVLCVCVCVCACGVGAVLCVCVCV